MDLQGESTKENGIQAPSHRQKGAEITSLLKAKEWS